jgi:hypothetical protein
VIARRVERPTDLSDMSPESQRRVARQIASESGERDDRTKHSDGILSASLAIVGVVVLSVAVFELFAYLGAPRWLNRGLTGLSLAVLSFGGYWYGRRNSTL